MPGTGTSTAGPVDGSASPHVRLRTLPYDAVTIKGGFWAQQRTTNRTVSLKHGYRMLHEAGNYLDLELSAGLAQGTYSSRLPFLDSDLYKWLEAVSFELGNSPDPELEAMADEAIVLIAKAQKPDGYINSYWTVVKPQPWSDLPHGHELYCAGHLFQAAVAHHRVTGKTSLLAIACRFADYIDSVFGPEKRRGVCGHPEVETALVELYRDTGEKRYLALAEYFLHERGHGVLGADSNRAAYYQDHVPVTEAKTVEGHAVRQLYLTTGMADAYMETGEQGLLEAMQRQWHDMTSRKLFITGGVGSRHVGEAFGEAYELPNDICYCETCAQIASFTWNWRMLLISGERRYADLMERTLFNSIISGRSLDGTRTRYENPLQRRGYPVVWGGHGNERKDWYDCACCPPNMMRLLSSLHHYLATQDNGGVQIHHFAPGDITANAANGAVHLHEQTDYPWQGTIMISVEESPRAPWALSLRIPAWCTNPVLKLNDRRVALKVAPNGYAVVERAWKPNDMVELELPMPTRLTGSHPRIDPARGSAAIERGPLVYCIESFDQPDGLNLMDMGVLKENHFEPLWRDDLLGGVVVIKARGWLADSGAWSDDLYRPLGTEPAPLRQSLSLTAIPYFAWDNRGLGAMKVWLPYR